MDAVGSKSSQAPCAECGYANPPQALTCSLCASVLRRAEPDPLPPAPLGYLPPEPEIAAAAGVAPFLQAPGAHVARSIDPTLWGWPRPLVVMLIGALLAPVFTFAPLLQYMGWFLASLVHETGHCVVAWMFGQPAFPAIRLDGHAAAIHSEQKIALVVFVALGLVWLTHALRKHVRLQAVAAGSVVVYLLLAFSDGREVLHLLAGHLGELAFAGVFFYRALSGGFTESTGERVTYATVAWYLVARNVVLTWGLMTSEGARVAYHGNGSFGLTNDLIRAAKHHLGWSLESVAGLVFLAALAVLPVAVALWLRHETTPRALGGERA